MVPLNKVHELDEVTVRGIPAYETDGAVTLEVHAKKIEGLVVQIHLVVVVVLLLLLQS